MCVCVCVCVCVCIIITIPVSVVSKSLCGFVANQVQYNMESAQYLGQSYYIIIINRYIIDLYI